jgi:hypothetical protein
MAVKIYNIKLKDVKISKKLNVQKGPGFWFDSERDLSTMYPAIADGASADTQKVSFNMGQTPFIGDPLGFEPYDPNYSVSNWQGEYSISGDILVPYNVRAIIYNKSYNTGKYYFEVVIEDDGYASAVGFAPSYGHHNRLTVDGVGVIYIGSSRNFINSIHKSAVWTDTYNILDHDILQVWVDFDNNRLCIKKLNTTINDHKNYIED